MFQMPRKYVKKVGGRPYHNYTDAYLQKVLDLVRTKQLSTREAMKQYGIHRNIIAKKLKQLPSTPGNATNGPVGSPAVPSVGSSSTLVDHSRKPGGQTALSAAEEEVICSHLIALASFGFPVTGRELRFLVQSYLVRIDRRIPYFRDNLPGRDWMNSFLQRHKEKLSVRMSQSVSRARAGLNYDTINMFFDNLTQELAGVPPENIWNYDESNLQDDPGSSKVIVKRGCKHPEIIKNATKASVSIMVCGNAVGTIVPVYVTYKALNVYPTWVEGGPPGTRFNRSKSGWFDARIFEDWFEFLMLPILRKQTGTKILLGDNLSSHLSSHVLTLCQQNNVKFIALPPNSTHMLQPLDVAFFGPMKRFWRKILGDWKNSPEGRPYPVLPKPMFPLLLGKLLNKLKTEGDTNRLQGGFQGSGIYPLNREVVLKKLSDRVFEEAHGGEHVKNVSETFLEELKNHRKELTEKNSRRMVRKKVNVPPGKGITVDDLNPPSASSAAGVPSTSGVKSRGKGGKDHTTKKRKQQEQQPDTDDDSSDEEILSDGDIPYAESEDSLPNMEVSSTPSEHDSADFENDPGVAEPRSNVSLPSASAAPENTEPERDDFVVVYYKGNMYPGKMLTDLDRDNDACVTCMKKKGKFWLWPEPPDSLWYHRSQIKKKIEPPKEVEGNLFEVTW